MRQVAASLAIVNFGCGPFGTPGYINVDGSPTVLLAKLPLPASWLYPKADFVHTARQAQIRYGRARRIRFPEESLDAFYSSHTLEHIPQRDCINLMTRVRTWLRPGGVVRIVLPDLRLLANAYSAGEIGAEAFVRRTYLAPDSTSMLSRLIGGGTHHWMYDARSFGDLLRRIGFNEIAQTEFGVSRMPELSELDLELRRKESFYIEAVR
jgi:predicted SAM-dependent methyltransferase